MEEEKANANSEIRYLALELTKIANRKKKPFSAVASEYVQNVHDLQEILKSRVSQNHTMRLGAQFETEQRSRKNNKF